MNRFLKTLLLWLLMAVVPLHAAATTLGMSCGPEHGTSVPAASVDHSAHHMDDTPAAHGHHDNAGMVHGDSATDDPVEPSSHTSCSACSAFCIGAVAPPSAIVAVPTFSGSEPITILPATRVAGFIPEGHKRPPRLIFA
jgi:hypothetical protein